MSANHTPGPWIFECIPGRSDGFVFSENQPEGFNICTIDPDTCVKNPDRRKSDDWVFSDRRAADARLIAAAPDLLAALESVLLDANVELPAERAALIQSVINQARGI